MKKGKSLQVKEEENYVTFSCLISIILQMFYSLRPFSS